MELKILSNINSSVDLKNLTIGKLNILMQEIRETLLEKISQTEEHFAPNLGIIEATIALHYVFNSPIDK